MAFPLDNEETWQQFLGVLRVGKAYGTACKAVRMSRRAVDAYLDSRADRAAEYVDAVLEATERVEEALYSLAVSGADRNASLAWLERRDRERWAPGAAAPSGRLVVGPEQLALMAAEVVLAEVDTSEVHNPPSAAVPPVPPVPPVPRQGADVIAPDVS